MNSKNHKLLVVRAECSSPSQPNRRPSQFQHELRFRPSVTQQKTVHDSSPSQPNRRRHYCVIHQRLHDSRRRPAPQSKARLCFNSGHKNRLLLYILRLSPFFYENSLNQRDCQIRRVVAMGRICCLLNPKLCKSLHLTLHVSTIISRFS